MNTVFACTHVEKEVLVDDFEKGCDLETRTCLMDERCNITGEILPSLLQAIGDQYGLDIDDIFLPWNQDGSETTEWISHNRLENADGFEPPESERERWKHNTLTLYLADYTFHIEKRVVSPVPAKEFEEAGIKCDQ